jgi:hypothetical protein
VSAAGANPPSVTVTVSQAQVCPALSITLAESRKTHGTAGTYAIAAGSVECRKYGVTRAVTVFNQAIQRLNGNNTDISVSSGTISAISVATTNVADDTLIVDMTNVIVNPVVWRLGYPGIAAACDANNKVAGTKCWKAISGDINQNGSVSSADVTTVVGKLSQVASATTFKMDWDYSGKVLSADTTGVVGQMGKTCTGCVCP